MSDMIVEQDIELKPEDLDKYVEVAANKDEELRDFLNHHYAEITKAHHEPNKWGESMTMPEAYQAPEYAGNIHRLKVASDNFVNACRATIDPL